MSAIDSFLLELVPRIGRNLARQFPGLDPSDVEQQCWVGVLEHKDELADLLDDGDKPKAALDARQYAAQSVYAMQQEQGRHDQAVQELKGQLMPEAKPFYTVPVLRALLPSYLDNGVSPTPPKGREVQPSRSGDPAEGGNWLAMMIDVDYAFWRIKKYHRKVLARYFHLLGSKGGSGAWTHEDVASAMGLPPATLKGRVYAALRAMSRQLGG